MIMYLKYKIRIKWLRHIGNLELINVLNALLIKNRNKILSSLKTTTWDTLIYSNQIKIMNTTLI